MEIAHFIEWSGDSRARFIERAIELEVWGQYEGHFGLGKRLIAEVDDKLKELKLNVNLYSERQNEERVVPLASSNHVLIYKKDHIHLSTKTNAIKILVIDVRRFY